MVVVHDRDGVDLKVWIVQAGLRLEVSPGLQRTHRRWPGFEQEILQSCLGHTVKLEITEHRHGFGDALLDRNCDVILQVLPNAGQFMLHLDAVRRDVARRPDTGELQNLW